MGSGVPALGVAVVALAGHVWYVPALLELRAGAADRPRSSRSAAAACLVAWATVALTAVVLAAGGAGWPALGAAGGAGAVVLRVRAALQARRESRETAGAWAELHRVKKA
ncbi:MULTISPECIES: hypothetical protein [Streptomyces]|uniref:hypothetical protein n=1 Tax=Streptomyces TaxID=1883 RepID=UPI00140BD07F|nr:MULTISPECIES: hypothetical protein [Streptomyces]MDH6225673.1 hypothetical protein [Streptomyces sp. MJP52]